LAVFLYQGNPDRNRKLWNIVSSERYIFHMQVLLQKGQRYDIPELAVPIRISLIEEYCQPIRY
jgi:hypothetical protein